MRLLILSTLMAFAIAFGPNPVQIRAVSSRTFSSAQPSETTTSTTAVVDPKEAVKIFGRLAEKYIMLDSSGGMCCYSACSDCEYRLPGGGYIMADSTATRPKWIPSYDTRSANGKEHTTKWSESLYDGCLFLVKEDFVEKVVELVYAPPLGGPSVSASGAAVEDTTAVEALFDVLADGKEKLTRHRMGMRLKQLADGEEGLTWKGFSAALCG